MKKKPNQELAIKDFSVLQIGDWVQDENGFPMVVVSLTEDWCNCDFEGNEGDVWEYDKENPCYHIPLSSAIVEANRTMLTECEIAITGLNGLYAVVDCYTPTPFDMPRTIGMCTTVDELQRKLRAHGYRKVAEEFNPIEL